jgi:hypothetical protein
MNNLRITIDFKTPVIASHPIHFDAVLSYAMFEHSGCLDTAHNGLPLKKTGDVYHGSALKLQGPVKQVLADFNGSLRLSDQDVDLFKPNSANAKKYLYIDTARGEHKAELNTYKAYFSKHNKGYFYACGDKEEIDALLKAYVFGIGKKHRFGYGAISSFTIDIIEEDFSFFHPEMGTMRNIPIGSVEDDKMVQASETELTSYYPPYYDCERKLCCVPSSFIDNQVLDVPQDDYF